MKRLKIDKEFGVTMIIVPHQDDEVLSTAGVLVELVKNKVPFKVVMVTNGDCDCTDYSKGRTRLLETVRGTAVLGVKEEQLEFMGYADTGMPTENSFIMHLYEEEDEDKIYPSSCTCHTYGLEEKPEFHMGRYGVHADYSRRMFKADLKQVIKEQNPENIFTTWEYDMHGDHEGLYRFICEILDELKQETDFTPSLYCSIIHSCAGDEIWPLRGTKEFDCPRGLSEQGVCWDGRLVLPLENENLKYLALSEYESALEPSAYEFLMSFVKKEEIFWKVR